MLFHNLFLWHQDIHFALLSSDKSNKCYCGLTLSTQPLVSSFNWWKLVFSFMMPHLYVCHCMSTYISPYHAWINAIPFLLGSLLTQFNVFRVLLPIWFSEHMTDHIIPSLILCILFWVPDTARLCVTYKLDCPLLCLYHCTPYPYSNWSYNFTFTSNTLIRPDIV